MGILSDMNTADDSGADDNAADDKLAAEQQAPADDKAKDKDKPKTERVELPTRRAEGRGRTNGIEKAVADLSKQLSDRDEKYRGELAERDKHFAELRGRFEQLSTQRQQPAQAPQPAADASTLHRSAREALDKSDFDAYQRLTAQALLAEIEQKYGQRLNAPTASAQIPLPVQAVLASFPDVVSHPKGMDLAVLEDRRLALDGIPDGPDRYRRAFEITRAQLGKPAPAGYSQASRSVLSGVPAGRAAAATEPAAGPGVQLTKYELEVAERCGMSKQEYAAFIAEAHPERLQQ